MIFDPMSDYLNLVRWIDRPGAEDFWARRTYQYPVTLEKVNEHFQRTLEYPKTLKIFKITFQEEAAGHVELDGFNYNALSVRITRMFVDPKFRNKGVAQSALTQLLQFCFEHLKMNRVELLVTETNHPAHKLYLKMGFTQEGYLRENTVAQGIKCGSYLLSMLRSDFFEWNLQPSLEGPTLILRPLQASDFDSLYAVASDPLIWEQHPAKNRFQKEVFQSFFDEAIQSQGALLVLDKKSGAVIGTSRFYDFHPEKKQLIIGYTFLARAYWGGFTNGEMKKLMMDHAFKKVDTILLHVGAQNQRSRKAVEKIGGRFVREFEKEYGASVLSVEYALKRM